MIDVKGGLDEKMKETIVLLSIMATISVGTSIHFANELNEEKQLNYLRGQMLINNYQMSFANAMNREKLNNISPSDLLHTIVQLNNSLHYYENISNVFEGMEYISIVEAYISALEDYILDNKNGVTTIFHYDIDIIYSDLILIGDWLRERNKVDTLVAHNDEDFYEIYLKLSSEVIDDIDVYATK